jgi:hypothetical protein
MSSYIKDDIQTYDMSDPLEELTVILTIPGNGKIMEENFSK